MLIYKDVSDLGDKKLNEIEATTKLREDTLQRREKFKIPNYDLLSNQDMAVGNSMEANEFIRRLTSIDPCILVEPGGIPGAVAVRVLVHDDDLESPTHGKYVKRYVSGFYADRKIPEFSSVVVEDDFTARREIRGWRTVLLQLIRQKVITYQQVKAVFGDPLGQRNSLWMSQTKEHRV